MKVFLHGINSVITVTGTLHFKSCNSVFHYLSINVVLVHVNERNLAFCNVGELMSKV